MQIKHNMRLSKRCYHEYAKKKNIISKSGFRLYTTKGTMQLLSDKLSSSILYHTK